MKKNFAAVCVSDPIGDMLTRMRNACSSRMKFVLVPFSSVRTKVLDVLKEHGYIGGYSVEHISTHSGSELSYIRVLLTYYESASVIRSMKRISRPGARVYRSSSSIPAVCNGLGISVVSTPMGIMSGRQARKLGVGGELLCEVV